MCVSACMRTFMFKMCDVGCYMRSCLVGRGVLVLLAKCVKCVVCVCVSVCLCESGCTYVCACVRAYVRVRARVCV